jgi:hypothetical protein
MKKELIVLFVIFIILSVGMHYEEWLSHPILHLKQLPSSGAYGIGAIHPLVFTLIVYILIWIPRGIFKLFKGIKKGS